MAHQSHNIPWNTLAETLKFKFQNRSHSWITNLYFTDKPDQSKRLRYFVSGFIRTLKEFSTTERLKYPDSLEPPKEDDVVLSLETARKIQHTVKRYREKHGPRNHVSDGLLSEDDRRMSDWLDYPTCSCCAYDHDYKRHIPTLALFKTLILHNEMDALLRIASHPDSKLHRLWEASCCWDHDGWGWRELVRKALMAYICLNVFYVKGETHGPQVPQGHLTTTAPQQRLSRSHGEYDYRLTYAYHYMLVHCTEFCGFPGDTTEMYPHRNFFGLPNGPVFRNESLYGILSSDQFRHMKASEPYQPLLTDIPIIINYLGQKGLPIELSLQVLGHAQYNPVRRPPILDDPLHVDNLDELRRYLNYCWRLLIRSEMLAKACGARIDWTAELTICIWQLWGAQNRAMVKRNNDDRQGQDQDGVNYVELSVGPLYIYGFV